jgi:hypothetical protein
MKLRALRVKVEILHANYEVQVNARRARGPGILNCGNSTNSAGSKDIIWSDQVVCVPLDFELYIRWLRDAETENEGLNTMSSGSSGHNVTAPEPLCSILFLMQRILAVRFHGYRPRA